MPSLDDALDGEVNPNVVVEVVVCDFHAISVVQSSLQLGRENEKPAA